MLEIDDFMNGGRTHCVLTPVGDPTSQGELGAGELLGFGGPKLELVLRGV